MKLSYELIIHGHGYADGNDSVWRIMAKSKPLVEPRGERCYSNKESSLQGMASQQNQIVFAFAVS